MEIRLYNDIVFKWIFGRQEHTRPLICFLNSVVGYDSDEHKFSEVKILNPFDTSEPFTNEKMGILDIRAKDIQTEEWIDLEIQVIYNEYYPQRSKYYLAGMYREQLKKSKEINYDDLKPCYGIHILIDSLFNDEADEKFWFNHYAMLNTRTHKPLINHWNLYYVELNKFLKCFDKMNYTKELEQWSYFIGTIQDNSKQLNSFFDKNDAIKEVFNMLQTFTKDDKLREQYRLHEEWLRVQRTEAALKEKLKKQYMDALRVIQQERQAKEQERRAKEDIQKRSILTLKQMGLSNDNIVNALNIPLVEVEKNNL
ncbi:MAG: Rpn family recombination-promoting nuclease/putative transposase [Desulfobacterales bacterium]|nr:Rpn family recombination-promoting nuclease/putative transposase [Desulfobacterales bacterium]